MPSKEELFRFVIPIKPTSWNTIACKNRWHYQRTRDFWKKAVAFIAHRHRPKQPYDIPVRLVFEAAWRGGRAHDCDNLFVKPVIDMLRMDGFFRDDDTRHIPEIILRGTSGQREDSLTVIGYAYIPR